MLIVGESLVDYPETSLVGPAASIRLSPRATRGIYGMTAGNQLGKCTAAPTRSASLAHVENWGRNGMPWRLVRLEHGRSAQFPSGSVVRGYLLRVPLRANGHIDTQIHALNPARSTARRFWPSEPIRSGYVIRQAAIWRLVSGWMDGSGEPFAWFEDCSFREGEQVSLTEPRRGAMPYLVANIRPD